MDLLEDLLADYPGTVFLVSHDRRFLDNVITSSIVAEGDGRWREYEGSVEDWLIQSRRAQAIAASKSTPPKAAAPAPAAATPPPAAPLVASKAKKKLSYKEQRELDELPARIEALEEEQRELNTTLADPDLYKKQDAHSIAGLQARIASIDDELLVLLERWETLGGA